MQVVTGSRTYKDVTIAEGAYVHLGDQHFAPALDANRERAAMMQALSYPAMNSKRAQLFLVDSPNLEWIWDVEDKAGFQSWLENVDDQRMFWISGKPASGKSTMIRYLSDHKEVAERLGKLTGNAWLILYFFFDFRSGNSTANNLDGLSRALLFQLVQRSPSIARIVAQSPLGDMLASTAIHSTDGNDSVSLDVTELLISTIEAADIKICAFIDGLDEYEGKPRDLVILLKALQKAGTKLCVASRSEPDLQLAFRGCPQFQMHEHNVPTIQKIVQTTIEDIPNQPPYVFSLIDIIVRDSEGVILWACFAADELRNALLRFDDEAAIQARLDDFPKSLEAVYDRILSKMSFRYNTEAALLLWLVIEALPNYDDKASHILCAMSAFQARGWLPSSLYKCLTLQSFCLRVQACFGQLVLLYTTEHGREGQVLSELNISGPEQSEYVELRILHKTLRTYLHHTSWLRARLPSAVHTLYPGVVWIRLKTELVLQGFDTDQWMMFASLIKHVNRLARDEEYKRIPITFSSALTRDILACCVKFVRISSRTWETMAKTRPFPFSSTARRDLSTRLTWFLVVYGLWLNPFQLPTAGNLPPALTEDQIIAHSIFARNVAHKDANSALEPLNGVPYTLRRLDELYRSDSFFSEVWRVMPSWTLKKFLPNSQEYVLGINWTSHKMQVPFLVEYFDITEMRAFKRQSRTVSNWLVDSLGIALEIEAFCTTSQSTSLVITDFGMPLLLWTYLNILVDTRIPALISCTGGMLPELLSMLKREQMNKQATVIAQSRRHIDMELAVSTFASSAQNTSSIMRYVLKGIHELEHLRPLCFDQSGPVR